MAKEEVEMVEEVEMAKEEVVMAEEEEEVNIEDNNNMTVSIITKVDTPPQQKYPGS